MEPIVFQQLLILMIVVWAVAVFLSKLGLPTIMGELVMGVILGPALLGWVSPNQTIQILADIGIFFLLLHAGIETKPREFFYALKVSWGVALIGAIIPFVVTLSIAILFGLDLKTAIFVGLTLTATAMVITLKVLTDLNLHTTKMARTIIAACIIDSVLTLILFSFIFPFLHGEQISAISLLLVTGKVILFFGATILMGYFLYPIFTYPLRSRGGKGFTFILVIALALALFADWLGLHFILGAYMAGLFFEEDVTSPEILYKVRDRIFAIAYSFLGPIFFISLGFHVQFDAIVGKGLALMLVLTIACFVGQIFSAGLMARQLKFTWLESITVGVGMSGRAEMAFILASLGLSENALNNEIFSILIFTTFLLNLLTSGGLIACSVFLKKSAYPPKQKDPQNRGSS